MTDISGFVVSLIALHLKDRKATPTFSFGYQRAEILGALASIIVVWIMNSVLLLESISRFKSPEHIDGKLMFLVGIIGIAVNCCLLFVFQHKPHHSTNEECVAKSHEASHAAVGALQQTKSKNEYLPLESFDLNRQQDSRPFVHELSASDSNINLRAAFIHAFGDFIQSVGVLIAALIIWLNPQLIIADPICSFVFCILVFASTFRVTKEIVMLLMEAVPANITIEKVSNTILTHPELRNIVVSLHKLHIWSLNSNYSVLTVHLVVKNEEQSQLALAKCQSIVEKCCPVECSTIQVETIGYERTHCKNK